MSITRAFDLTADNPDWHYMNDGVLSPEYASAPAGYFRFSVVRNPWDRFVSGWKYCPTTCHRSLHDVPAKLPREGHDYRHVTRPQHAILFDEHRCLIVDYLIRFESLQQGFDQVCDMLGKPRCVLPHDNPGVRTHYSDYFGKKGRRIFMRHFGRDVALCGYTY